MGNGESTNQQSRELEIDLYNKIKSFIREPKEINHTNEIVPLPEKKILKTKVISNFIDKTNYLFISQLIKCNNIHLYSSILTHDLTESLAEDNGIETDDLPISDQIKILQNKLEETEKIKNNQNSTKIERTLLKNNDLSMIERESVQKTINENVKENSLVLTSNLGEDITNAKYYIDKSKDFNYKELSKYYPIVTQKFEDITDLTVTEESNLKNLIEKQKKKEFTTKTNDFDIDYFSFENYMKKETENLSKKYGKDLENLMVSENSSFNNYRNQNISKNQRSSSKLSKNSISISKNYDLKKNTFSREKAIQYNQRSLKMINESPKKVSKKVGRNNFSPIKLNKSIQSLKIPLKKSSKNLINYSSNKNLFENQNEIINRTIVKLDLKDIKKSIVNPNKLIKPSIVKISDLSTITANPVNISTKKDNYNKNIKLISSPTSKTNKSLMKSTTNSYVNKVISPKTVKKPALKLDLRAMSPPPQKVSQNRLIKNQYYEKSLLFKQEKEIENQPKRHTLKIDLKALIDNDKSSILDLNTHGRNETIYQESSINNFKS